MENKDMEIGILMQTGGGRFDWVPYRGEPVEDIINNEDAPAPINTPISVRFEEGYLQNWDWAPDTCPQAFVNDRIKDVALVLFRDPGNNQEGDKKLIKDFALGLQDYLIQTNEGQWEYIRVTPYVVENDTRMQVGNHLTFELLKDQMESQHEGRFDQHNYWHCVAADETNHKYTGLGYRNSSRATTWINRRSFKEVLRTICHEAGHCLGLDHSRSDGGIEYSSDCKMGRAYCGFNASQLLRLIQIKEDHIDQIVEDEIAFLAPVEVSNFDLRAGEYKGLVIVEGRDRYLLSTRKPKHQTERGLGTKEGVVYIHRVYPQYIQGPVYQGTILEGEYRSVGGLEIKNVGSKGGIVKVSSGGNENKSFPQPLEPSPCDRLLPSMSGAWNNQIHKNQGLYLFVNENAVNGYWFTFHPQGEHTPIVGVPHTGQEWFVINGEIDSGTNVVDVTILNTENGESYYEEGRGTIRLVGEQMIFRSITKTYGRDHLKLTQTTAPMTEPCGVFETGKKEGFAVGKHGDLYVVFEFTYAMKNRQWRVYSGRDPSALPGLLITSKHKQTFTDRQEALPPIDLADIMVESRRVV